MPVLVRLLSMVKHAQSLLEAEDIQKQVDAIRDERRLLEHPILFPHFINMSHIRQQVLNQKHKTYTDTYEREMKVLTENETWKRLSKDQQAEILHEEQYRKNPRVIHRR